MRFMPSSMYPISIAFAGILVLSPLEGMAAEWLAPAADERISAEWVQDIAKAFKKDRYKNVFMNQPFGCDQCRIVGYLNNAAEALESEQPKLAKSFVRRSLAVLNQGLEDGWYTKSDVQTVKHLILRKARQGFQEAGAPQMAMTGQQEPAKDPRYEHGDEPLFSGPEASDRFPSKTDRWGGYTEGTPYGLTERLDRARQGRHSDRETRRESGSARSGQSDESRFERGDRDDVALEQRRRSSQDRSGRQASSFEQEADQRTSRDRSHRRGRASFPEDMTAEDALNALMQDDQEESS